jgi:hypothetical protein
MDRKLCLNRESVKLYKIVNYAIDAITGISLVIYHYIENSSNLFVIPEEVFKEKFVRLKK